MTVTLKCSKVAPLPPEPSTFSDSLATGLAGAVVGVAVTVTVGASLGGTDAVTVAVSAGWAVPFGVVEQAERPSMSNTGAARVTLILNASLGGWLVGQTACRLSTLVTRAPTFRFVPVDEGSGTCTGSYL